MKWQEFIAGFQRVVDRFAGLLGCLVVCGRTDLKLELHVGATAEECKSPVAGYSVN